MADLKKLYKELGRYRNFEENDNDQKFLEVVDKIIEFKTPDSIRVLFKYFDDNNRSWVLECLKGTIKSTQYLNDQDYTIAVLQNLHLLMGKAKNWAVGFFYIILNIPECVFVLEKSMSLAKKDHLIQVFDIIEKESPHHVQLIKKLRDELEKKK